MATKVEEAREESASSYSSTIQNGMIDQVSTW